MAPYKIKTAVYFILIFVSVFCFSSCEKRRTPVAYQLPESYTGWVTVKFEKPGAPPLKEEDGFYHIKISDSGYAETSSIIEEGWAEDKFYWLEGGKPYYLQQYSEDKTSMIHGETYSDADFKNFVNPDTLQVGKEYTLYDGSKITKLDNKGGMKQESGRHLLYTFFVSEKQENIWDFQNHKLPPIPKEHSIW